jgi:hypothetical protein
MKVSTSWIGCDNYLHAEHTYLMCNGQSEASFNFLRIRSFQTPAVLFTLRPVTLIDFATLL